MVISLGTLCGIILMCSVLGFATGFYKGWKFGRKNFKK